MALRRDWHTHQWIKRKKEEKIMKIKQNLTFSPPGLRNPVPLPSSQLCSSSSVCLLLLPTAPHLALKGNPHQGVCSDSVATKKGIPNTTLALCLHTLVTLWVRALLALGGSRPQASEQRQYKGLCSPLFVYLFWLGWIFKYHIMSAKVPPFFFNLIEAGQSLGSTKIKVFS